MKSKINQFFSRQKTQHLLYRKTCTCTHREIESLLPSEKNPTETNSIKKANRCEAKLHKIKMKQYLLQNK